MYSGLWATFIPLTEAISDQGPESVSDVLLTFTYERLIATQQKGSLLLTSPIMKPKSLNTDS